MAIKYPSHIADSDLAGLKRLCEFRVKSGAYSNSSERMAFLFSEEATGYCFRKNCYVIQVKVWLMRYVPFIGSFNEIVSVFPYEFFWKHHAGISLWAVSNFGPSAVIHRQNINCESKTATGAIGDFLVDCERDWLLYSSQIRFKNADAAILYKMRWL